MKRLVLAILLSVSVLLAANPARINVITDLGYGARIYVDGQLAGRDAVQNYRVDAGEHYVSVVYNNKKIFAKTYALRAGQLKTVATAHFVGFKTDVANRGAIDVEAARIRETRGSFGIGAYSSTAAGGISIKKWFGERWGLQAYGLIHDHTGGTEYQSGGRVLFWIADKVLLNAPFSGYLFLGGGRTNFLNPGDSEKNMQTNSSHGGLGIEFSILGVSGLYVSLEAGVENKYYRYSDTTKENEMKGQTFAGGGLHLYF